jgi:spore coat polysaccharide biosynthesis protein SpsF
MAVVQARTSSQRLPNKVLLEVQGKPLLEYTLDRLARARSIARVIVATSSRKEDDRVAELCERRGVHIHRGSLDDVLGRLIEALCVEGGTALVRISGDSPLIDPKIVDRVVDRFRSENCDLATNVFPRSYPKGQSVEVVALDALERAAATTADRQDREHVTRFFYRHPEAFTIRNVAYGRDLSEVQLSVDTGTDFDLISRVISAMTRPHWDYGMEEILAIRERLLEDRTRHATAN